MWDAWDIDEFHRHHVTDLVDVDSLELSLRPFQILTLRVARV